MTDVHALLPLVAAVASLNLAGLALLRWRPGRERLTFSLGMAAFAAEAVAVHVLLGVPHGPVARAFWLRWYLVAGLLAGVSWAAFVAGLGHRRGVPLSPAFRIPLVVGGALAVVAAAGVVGVQGFETSVVAGPFEAVRLDGAGRFAAVVQLLLAIGILAGLEACLRTSRGVTRERVKYTILGLAGIFLVRFYVLSQVILFHHLSAEYLKTGAVTVLLGTLVIAAALARNHLRSVELSVSRHVLYRSAVVAVLGLYLFAVGVLGWLLNYLEIPDKTFWGSLVIFVSALAVAALMLSEDLRWRINRFIGLNFYRSKYDYRAHWLSFTRRLGSLLTLEALAPALVEAVTTAVGSPRGALYLAGPADERFRPVAAVGVAGTPGLVETDSPLAVRLRAAEAPGLLEEDDRVGLDDALTLAFPDGSAAVPLAWGGTLIGFMLVAPERTGDRYGAEDLEFMAAVGDQAAGSIMTARLSEAAARTREFEAFHRLTSFVIHDLKNSVSALSMLSSNALRHFDDPEFQRDTVRTLSRTVDRMKALLARLASPVEAVSGPFEPVDLAELAREAMEPVRADGRVRLVTALAPVPPVSGDPEALLRVVQNLVTNAVEAMDGAGGTVRVEVAAAADGVALTVTDTGCGMSEEFIRTSLFAPFRSTKQGGWGIGLYQAREIVERHAGTIAVTSRVGAGTTFRIRFPAATPQSGDVELAARDGGKLDAAAASDIEDRQGPAEALRVPGVQGARSRPPRD